MGGCESLSILNSSYFRVKLNKKVINFNQVKQYCQILGQGYNSNVYYYPKFNIALKIMKRVYVDSINKEINILDHLQPIWPNLCQYQILQNDKLIGFSVKFVQGKKIDSILQDKTNIFHKSPECRIRLVKKLKNLISKIQDLNICHGDIFLDNIIINQLDQNSEECQLTIIDFGNGLIFDSKTQIKDGLTGWKFNVPPQVRSGQKYNPVGVNTYQLGRMALHILLLTPLSGYHTIPLDPTLQLNQLQKKEFDPCIRKQIEEYLHDDAQIRIKALKEPSKMKQQLRRSWFESFVK